MRIQGAVIREQGQTFAIAVVKPHVVRCRSTANQTIAGLRPTFGVPVVLMAQDGRGRPTYFGPSDIVRFLSSVPLRAIPWQEYRVH